MDSSKRRVLLGDDSRDTVDSLRMCFEAEGCKVHVCRSGREILDCAIEFRPNVAILDLDFGSAPDGVEVIRQLRAHLELTRLVLAIVTGWTRAIDRERSVGAGCDYFFHKPVNPDVLVRIALTLDRRHHQDTNVSPLIERRVAVVKPDAETQVKDDVSGRQERHSLKTRDRLPE